MTLKARNSSSETPPLLEQVQGGSLGGGAEETERKRKRFQNASTRPNNNKVSPHYRLSPVYFSICSIETLSPLNNLPLKDTHITSTAVSIVPPRGTRRLLVLVRACHTTPSPFQLHVSCPMRGRETKYCSCDHRHSVRRTVHHGKCLPRSVSKLVRLSSSP